MSYGLSNDERETTVLFDDSSNTASIYTCDKKLIKKLDGFCKKRPDLYKLVEKDPPSKTYTFPKKYIKIRLPKTLSLKQKEHLREVGFKKKVKINF